MRLKKKIACQITKLTPAPSAACFSINRDRSPRLTIPPLAALDVRRPAHQRDCIDTSTLLCVNFASAKYVA
jgi:hypothetical protein